MPDLNEDAARELVKITVQKIAEDKGAKVAAKAAGVSEGRWSHYGSLEHPREQLPFWRALMLEQRLGRNDFSALMGQGVGKSSDGSDPRKIAGNALSILAALTNGLNEALDDDELTENERRELLPLADRLADAGAHIKQRLVSNNVTSLKRGA